MAIKIRNYKPVIGTSSILSIIQSSMQYDKFELLAHNVVLKDNQSKNDFYIREFIFHISKEIENVEVESNYLYDSIFESLKGELLFNSEIFPENQPINDLSIKSLNFEPVYFWPSFKKLKDHFLNNDRASNELADILKSIRYIPISELK